MPDEPAVIEPSPAEGSVPFDHALVVYPSNSNRAVDLEPPPYVANPVISVIGADRGLGIRHIENSLIVTFERWVTLNVGDVFEFYMGGSPFELAWAEVRPGEENRPRYQLAIPRELVPLGFVSSCYGRVVRVGSGTESTSVPQTWLIKDTRPGGADQDPGLPYHSALKLHLPLDLQRPGSVLDPDRAALGVVLTIDRYPEIRIRDTIELYWNGHLVTLQLDADHISGARPIEVRVEPEIINRPHGSGLLTIRFRVRDEVLNFSGEIQQWSQVVHLESDLDPDLLERPYFLVDDEDITDVNFDTQGEGRFEVEVYVPSRLPNGSTTPAGTQILVTLSGIRADGSEHIVHLPAFTARIGRSSYAHVENSILKALINGSMQISYELQFPLGTVLGTSRRLTVTIFGTVSTMPPVDVVEDDAGLIDPSIDYITVEFPEYTPYDRNYSVTLRMEATRTGGGVEFYEQTLLAGAPPPPTRFRIVPRSEFLRFVGLGDVKIFYRVDDGLVGVLGGSGALAVRESEHLIVHFGERVAELPEPQLDRVDEHGNLDPDDVIGQAIVTLPYVRTFPGDTFIWRWLGTGDNGSTGDDILLNGSSAGRPVVFGVDKVFVDNNRNGEIRLSYTLIPASGGALRSKILIVSVGQALGNLLRPEVLEASRNPDQLTPEAVTQDATIQVKFPQMLPTDRIRAVWTGIPGIGSHSETKDGNSQKTLNFTVPADVVGANIAPFGRQISVQYFLLRGTREIPSLILDLLLLTLNTLPIPTIEGVGDVPILNLSRLTGNERTMINTWHFIHRNQRMWMHYTGTYADPEGTYFEATYTNNLVTADGEVNGIMPPAPVDELRKLKDGSDLLIQFWVSFDRGSEIGNAVLFRERRHIVQALPSELPAPRFHNLPGASLSIYPLQYENYAFVAVAYEGMNSTHFIELQWIYPDCTMEPISGKSGLDGGRVDFPISARIIANSVGKTITLRYVATIRTGTVTSDSQELTVEMIRPEDLPQPLINGLPDGGVLDLAAFTGPGKASVSKWPLSFINQRVWLTCSSPGVNDLKVLESYPINSGEAAAGLVNKDVARAWLSTVQHNGSITVSCDVTLDGSTERGGQAFPLTTYSAKNIPTGENFDEVTDFTRIGYGESLEIKGMKISVIGGTSGFVQLDRDGSAIPDIPGKIENTFLQNSNAPVVFQLEFKTSYSRVSFWYLIADNYNSATSYNERNQPLETKYIAPPRSVQQVIFSKPGIRSIVIANTDRDSFRIDTFEFVI